MGGGGKNAASRAADRQRKDEQQRQQRIRQGTERVNDTFGQFDDDFFAGQRDAFLDYARPQLDDQFGDASEQLTFNLARAGLLDSSVRGEQAAGLQQDYDTNLTDIRNRALDVEGQARTRVEDTRSDILRTLQATADADGAANAALGRVDALATPPSYSPLGQLFTDSSAALATQAALERAESLGSRTGPRFNTGLFGVPGSAVRTRR